MSVKVTPKMSSVKVTPKMSSEEAEALLKQRLGSQVVGLRVRFHEGGIALQGTAYSYYAKQLAQHGAMRIFGLPILANEIEVRLNPRPPDSEGFDLA
jgi:osmotically-inducible protein OsmY